MGPCLLYKQWNLARSMQFSLQVPSAFSVTFSSKILKSIVLNVVKITRRRTGKIVSMGLKMLLS